VHPVLLLALYVAVIFAPLGLALLQGKLPRPLQDELASGLALVAFAILLVEFVLSGRFRAISGRLGMDVTMRFHQLLARTALALIVLHPFLYTTPLNPPLPWDVTRQLTLNLEGWSIITGIIAFVLLPALVLTAIFRDQVAWKYETWRLVHGLGALLVALLGTHHVIAAGRYSSDPVLGNFWLGLLTLAAASLVWIYAAKPLYQLFNPYVVRSVCQVADRTWEIVIEPRGHPGLSFSAGQFVWLNVGHTPLSLYENPFSISSAPSARPEIAFLIKEAGDFTCLLGGIRPGTKAYLDGPHGNLTLEHRRGRGLALLGVSVGIAPLLSILREQVRTGDPRRVILVYGNRHKEDIAYRDELDVLSQRDNISVLHVLSRPPDGWEGLAGRVDPERIRSLFSFAEARDWLYFICGPSAMMETTEEALIALGVPPGQIISERFRYD
jgi:predicted ferric reductase